MLLLAQFPAVAAAVAAAAAAAHKADPTYMSGPTCTHRRTRAAATLTFLRQQLLTKYYLT